MDSQFLRAEELGIRLEIVGGLPIWEASPVYKHQKEVDRIRESIKKTKNSDTNCECLDVADVYVQFPDGSLKRPDISIFCREPEEMEDAIKQVPTAVIEVISKGYEAKDLEISPPVYLENGVQDVVVLNPYTDEVFHFRADGINEFTSPTFIELECGCNCLV
ncbi:MAG: Uma2 family endonuclease [Acidobacteriota bacterium]|jgi:Uma2 family endonuclease|nr:Uma2 family endonuclease [Acidobacteriota bacterium]